MKSIFITLLLVVLAAVAFAAPVISNIRPSLGRFQIQGTEQFIDNNEIQGFLPAVGNGVEQIIDSPNGFNLPTGIPFNSFQVHPGDVTHQPIFFIHPFQGKRH